jgi:serine/threonine protein kinase
MSQKILINQFKSSKLNSEFIQIDSVTIEDNHFGKGGFGTVYRCLAINDQPLKTPQAIKVFDDNGTGSVVHGYNTLLRLQQEMIRHNDELNNAKEKTLDKINALKALPQFSFQGTIGLKRVLGYSANYLDGNSWCQFDSIFNDDDIAKRKILRNTFYNISIDNRLKIAYDLAEGFAHLGRMNFIYADLNPQNFFVNMKDFQLCLIDYEGGAVNDEPETFGKPGEWLAPEIQEQLRVGQGLISVDMHTDTWAVAIGIHFILFPFHPLFFLKVRGKNEMREYLLKYKYPNIDLNDRNFREPTHYQWYLQQLKNIQSAVIKAFADTINYGHDNRNKRLSYKQWMRAIENLMTPPEILSFIANPNEIVKGEIAELSWQIKGNVEKLLVDNGIGEVTGKLNCIINPERDSSYVLHATNAFGQTHQIIDVKVLPAPEIQAFSVKHQKLRQGQKTELLWDVCDAKEVKVLIGGKSHKLDLKGQMEIQPLKDTVYEIVATALNSITTVSQKIKVVVFQPVVIKEFKADKYFIIQSMEVVLTWISANATEVIISAPYELEKTVSSKSSLSVLPRKPTTYTLTAKNEMFTVTELLSIDVQSLPIMPRLDSLIPSQNILPKLDLQFNQKVRELTDDVELSFDRFFSPNKRFRIKDKIINLLKKR